MISPQTWSTGCHIVVYLKIGCPHMRPKSHGFSCFTMVYHHLSLSWTLAILNENHLLQTPGLSPKSCHWLHTQRHLSVTSASLRNRWCYCGKGNSPRQSAILWMNPGPFFLLIKLIKSVPVFFDHDLRPEPQRCGRSGGVALSNFRWSHRPRCCTSCLSPRRYLHSCWQIFPFLRRTSTILLGGSNLYLL